LDGRVLVQSVNLVCSEAGVFLVVGEEEGVEGVLALIDGREFVEDVLRTLIAHHSVRKLSHNEQTVELGCVASIVCKH
tara:strand:+ start:1428 stop:1661 length:234 start_codon:yes stop_codon:yes gene_type:complete